jgi:hypothetical protein
MKTENLTISGLAIPVNLTNIAKIKARSPRWTVFSEWTLATEEEAIKAHLEGADVIWALVNPETFNKSLEEYNSGDYKTAKGKLCDANKNRTIVDATITGSQYVLLDVDKRSFLETPELIKNNAWMYYPSASVSSVTESPNGQDVPKMHFIFKMPQIVSMEYVKAYRKICLELLTRDYPDFDYDRSVVNPRWEFYGKHPDFNDARFIKRDDSKVIPFELHNQILEQAIAETEAAKIKRTLNNQKKTLTDAVDEYLLTNSSTEAICNTVFDAFDWQEKHHSHGTFSQFECKAEMFDPDAKSGNGLALYESENTGRILITHKGTNRTCNLYEFYARYQLFLDGKECVDASVEMNGKNFKRIVDEICNKLEIEPYTFDDPNKINNETVNYDEFLPEYVKVLGDKTDKSTYYYWDMQLRVWSHTLSHETLVRNCLAPLVCDRFNTTFPSVMKQLEAIAKKHIKMSPVYAIKEPMEGDSDLIGFVDGTYSLSKRELLTDIPDHKIFRRYSFEFEKVNSDINDRVERVLKKWANLHPNDWRVVRDWFWASFLKLGQSWSAGMFFYGSPGSGKSMMVKALGLIDPGAVLSIQAEDVINNNHPFSKYSPSHHALYIDDISDANAKGMNVLYELLTENSKVPYTAKWVNSMELPRHATFAFTSENFPVSLRSQRTGMLRRAIAVEVNHGEKGFKKIGEELKSIFLNRDVMREWFLWSIQNVDVNALLERYRTYVTDESRKEVLKSAIASDSPMVQFSLEELVVGEDPNDFVLLDEFLERLKAYARKTNDTYLMKLNDLMLKKQAISDISQGHKNGQKMIGIMNDQKNTQGQMKQKRIDGQLKSVVWGIRFKTAEEILKERGSDESVTSDVSLSDDF